VSSHLKKLQRQLCSRLQDGLPICSRPFAEIAKAINSTENEVLRQISELKKTGVIRRISALINYRAVGMTGTLVTAHIADENIQEVAGAVNSLPNVSHNYLRNHYYNLWFTLQADSVEQIDLTISNLAGRFGTDFHSLPARRTFKLNVRFDTDGPESEFSDVEEIPQTKAVELTENEKLILRQLQNPLEPIAEPFDFLHSENLKKEDALRIIRGLIDKGVIRRIAAVLDHHKLGFVANVLFACKVEPDKIVQAGTKLARLAIVSHCYQRKGFENWPYNLFAMIHAKSMGEIQSVIDKFSKTEKIDSFELLPTAAELKKQAVRYCF